MSLVDKFCTILGTQERNYDLFDLRRTTALEQEPVRFAFDNVDLGVYSLPQQSERLKEKNGAAFNLLVVGQSGVGKTSFINTLFGSSLLPNVWQNVEDSKPNVFFEKTTKITRNKLLLVEDNFNLDFTVIDTPGFCDFIDNQYSYVPITEYIDQQLRLYMFQEEQPDRIELIDNRIHVCLYFINPTSRGLNSYDIEALRHISNRVNLIPVITKADTLTYSELTELKGLIRKIIDVQDIKVCEFIEDEDVKQGILANIPYALINSESYVSKEDGSSVRGRKYDWGIAEVDNEDHCDFIKLRKVLMSDNMIDLIQTTEAYYDKCRNTLINTRINKAKDTLEENEIPSGYSFENPDKNGLSNYKILSKFNKSFVDDLVIEWNPIFVQTQLNQRKRFSEIVNIEEKKFKDWKKALISKQACLNDEIDQYHQNIKILDAEIRQLKLSLQEPSAQEDNNQQQEPEIVEETDDSVAEEEISKEEPNQ